MSACAQQWSRASKLPPCNYYHQLWCTRSNYSVAGSFQRAHWFMIHNNDPTGAVFMSLIRASQCPTRRVRPPSREAPLLLWTHKTNGHNFCTWELFLWLFIGMRASSRLPHLPNPRAALTERSRTPPEESHEPWAPDRQGQRGSRAALVWWSSREGQ